MAFTIWVIQQWDWRKSIKAWWQMSTLGSVTGIYVKASHEISLSKIMRYRQVLFGDVKAHLCFCSHSHLHRAHNALWYLESVLLVGSFDPPPFRFVIVTTWSGPEMSAYQQFGVLCQLFFFFLLDQVWVHKKVQRFNKSARQKAQANKPAAGLRMMADTDNIQMVEQRSGIHSQ